jgi:hypothetical protein
MELLPGLLQFIGLVLIVLLLIFVGVFLYYFFINLHRLQQQRELDEAKQELVNTMLVNVQSVNGTLMMYDCVTGLFVAQADTLDDLWDAVDLRFPDMKVILTETKEVK